MLAQPTRRPARSPFELRRVADSTRAVPLASPNSNPDSDSDPKPNPSSTPYLEPTKVSRARR